MARANIKPKIVDVGRGPQLARITYSEGGVRKELPPDGAMVDMSGSAMSFWLRRRNEGVVDFTTEAEACALMANSKGATDKAFAAMTAKKASAD